MVFEHDYSRFPELSNQQISEFGITSPHKQIVADFEGEVIRVHDGDTVTMRTSFRDFDFPVRLLDIDAPEMNEGGEVARDWLRERVLGKTVTIQVDKRQRVGKYGRLLGKVISGGFDVGLLLLQLGFVRKFGERTVGEFPNPNIIFELSQWH